MNANALEALFLILAAAVMNATYTLPMKLNRKWGWEHSWFAFTVVGVLGVPALLTILTVPQVWSIYSATPAATLAAMALFGAGWGVSLVLFGLAVAQIGVAITFAVSLGTSAAAGALIPLMSQHPEQLATRQGALILAGIAIILLGVGLCGVAGNRRDASARTQLQPGAGRFLRGFIYAFISGVLGCLLNLGLAFGGGIQQAAADRGASVTMMSNAVWLPCLFAGFIPGVLYCLYLMKKNGNLPQLSGNGRWYYWIMAACMGALWYGSIILYSLSAQKLGDLGTAIGWPLFLSAIVVASAFAGWMSGEWSAAGRGPIRIMAAGVLCLVIAIGVLSQASR